MSRALVVVFSMVVSIYAINRPVYKIVLTQKGYAQFLQYDVVTPPLTEFTFCTWIRVYELAEEQSIFTYVVNGNTRIIRLWLDSGGQYMKVSINGKTTSDLLVEVVKDVWRHVCLSYQSDYGAWSLYVDSRLVSCESSPSLYGYVLPGGGSVIIGYGTADNGASNGFEGEIFGANMILSSTIERNFTMKADPVHGQKRFPRNKLKDDSKNTNYVVLSDLLNDKIQNNFEKTNIPQRFSVKSYNKLHTSNGFDEHSVSIDSTTAKNSPTKPADASQEDFDFTVSDFRDNNKEKIDFWNTHGNPKFTFAEVYKAQATKPTRTKLLNSATKVVPMVSEYETPPPPSLNFYYYNTEDVREHTPRSIYNLSNDTTASGIKIYNKHPGTELVDIETPPPIDRNTKVYGQWTSSRFAGTVLNYLKSINYKNRENVLRRVPQTIPLHKISDSHPYPSEFKLNILRPPSQFKNRKVVEKRFDIIRRDPQIYAHNLDDDLRLNIIKMHAETQPKRVEIRSRGASNKRKEHRFSRNSHYDENSKEKGATLEEYQPKPFALKEDNHDNHRYYVKTFGKTRTSKLPFLKSLEYLMRGTESSQAQVDDKNEDRYTKSLSQKNKWHNAKSYSNDYTPRKINVDYTDILENSRKLYPSLRLKYVPSKSENRDSQEDVDPSILHARKLATEVSNQSLIPQDSVSISKYNHRYLQAHSELSNLKLRTEDNSRKRVPSKRNMKATNFDQHVKLGNALNERIVIGFDEDQKEKSFVGGNENIPDINKYRSELDDENTNLPSPFGPRVCKNVELYDRVLYVQPDESIDLTHILSPVREKNIAIEFVMQNYKKCSLTDSSFQNNAMLLIDWSKTPVRLFGGAYPRTTTDLCGFF